MNHQSVLIGFKASRPNGETNISCTYQGLELTSFDENELQGKTLTNNSKKMPLKRSVLILLSQQNFHSTRTILEHKESVLAITSKQSKALILKSGDDSTSPLLRCPKMIVFALLQNVSQIHARCSRFGSTEQKIEWVKRFSCDPEISVLLSRHVISGCPGQLLS